MGNRFVAIQIQIYSLFVLHFNTKMKVIPKYACNTPTSYMRCCSLFAPNNFLGRRILRIELDNSLITQTQTSWYFDQVLF